VGRSEEAVRHAEHALRLSPIDRSLFYYYNFLLLAHYAAGNYEEAVKWGRMSENENPAYTANLRVMVAALAALGRQDEAYEVAANLIHLEPNFQIGEYARTRQPFRSLQVSTTFLEHLRNAGLPE
jgi:adenylate cyclase